ncbi:uncharacterized protein EURHEDRAFT_417883 [Aspergillus ruber CBS 135680]|uniref:Uncharacterized protein n=1 Tax=Aspergillus ruber (strain CBS 135680) TaxID=1388766 RepID=A0A017S047_ASPRC|nr:uncharacterized protein EURHEDRAFT_417883 [Aspergillus ruber CBS 135680]EYE89999.1 hypothetical protein EURHEDRAFT_417883 [Aspergillus ruber CBS 135680]
MGPFMLGPPADQRLLSFWLLLPAVPSYLGFPLRTSGCSAALLWSFILKSHGLFFGQAPEFRHGIGNFLVIQHPGLAVNWRAPLPLHSRLSTPPGSIHLHIRNYCILFISACLTCEAWSCNTQMRLAQGTGSRPPGVTSR